MLSQLVIPESEVLWLVRLVVTYIIGAIGWGVRVEMKLAALTRESKSQAEHTARNEVVMQSAIKKLDSTHDSVIRIEEGIKQIKDALK